MSKHNGFLVDCEDVAPEGQAPSFAVVLRSVTETFVNKRREPMPFLLEDLVLNVKVGLDRGNHPRTSQLWVKARCASCFDNEGGCMVCNNEH